MTVRQQQILGRLRGITVGVAGCPPEAVTEDVTFLELGFDSLSLMQLATALQDAFSVRITFRQLFDVMPSVAAVVRHIDCQTPDEASANEGEAVGQTEGAALVAAGETAGAISNATPDVAASARAAGPGRSAQPGADPAVRPAAARTPSPDLQRLILQQLDVMARQLAALERASQPRQPEDAAPVGASLATAHASAHAAARGAPVTTSVSAPASPLASPLASPMASGAAAIVADSVPATTPRRFPTTDSQQELWLTASLDREAACALNEATAYWIDGSLDADALVLVIEDVLARHQALNVRFADDGESQWVDPADIGTRIRVRREDLSRLDTVGQQEAIDAAIAIQAATPFDLTEGPLGRVLLVRLGEQRHLLLTYFSHVAYDGYSGGLLMAEIASGYNARLQGLPLPPSTAVPFSDYVEHQRSRDPALIDRARSYWARQFPSLPPALTLPTRVPRDGRFSWTGGTFHRALAPGQLDTVRALARTCGTTVSIVLLAAFQLLLVRLARQDEIVIGLPAAGQAHLGVACVGYCVNTLPIRSSPRRGKPFTALVQEARAAVLDAIDHQDLALGAILRDRRFVAPSGRLPLVEVMFNFSAYQAGVSLDGCRLVAHETRRQAVVHDLFLHVVESGDRLFLDCDFRSALFDEATIEQWMADYVNLIDTVASMTATSMTDGSMTDAAPTASA